jgi:hypothetical protein
MKRCGTDKNIFTSKGYNLYLDFTINIRAHHRIFTGRMTIFVETGLAPVPLGSPFMFDILWLALTIALFGVSLAFLGACKRM